MRQADCGVLVELCGLPGAGKSYIASRIVAAAARRGTVVRVADAAVSADVAFRSRLRRKTRLAGAYSLHHPAKVVRLARQIGRSGQPTARDVVSGWLQWVVTQRLLEESKHTACVHLFEEGMLQALWSLGLRGDLATILRPVQMERVRLVVPDLVIVVDAPLAVIARRLQSRQSLHSRTQSLDGAERDGELRRGLALFEELVGPSLRWLSASGCVVRLANPDGGPRAEDVAHVVDHIEQRAARVPLRRRA